MFFRDIPRTGFFGALSRHPFFKMWGAFPQNMYVINANNRLFGVITGAFSLIVGQSARKWSKVDKTGGRAAGQGRFGEGARGAAVGRKAGCNSSQARVWRAETCHFRMKNIFSRIFAPPQDMVSLRSGGLQLRKNRPPRGLAHPVRIWYDNNPPSLRSRFVEPFVHRMHTACHSSSLMFRRCRSSRRFFRGGHNNQ